MYRKIENNYKNKSLSNLCKTFLFVFLIAFIVGLFFLVDFISLKNESKQYLVTIIYMFSFFFFIHFIQIIFLIIKKRINRKNWKIIFSFEDSMKLFWDLIYEIDSRTLFKELYENGVNNKEDLKVAIDHYGALINKKNIFGNVSLTSLLALFISIFTYISNDGVYYDSTKLELIVSISAIISLAYFIIWLLVKVFIILLGQNEMYIRIEEHLSDIYYNFEKYREENKTKILIIKYSDFDLSDKLLISDKYKIELKNKKEINNFETAIQYKKVFVIKSCKNKNCQKFVLGAIDENGEIIKSKIDIQNYIENKKVKILSKNKNKKINSLYLELLYINENTLFMNIAIENIDEFKQLICE